MILASAREISDIKFCVQSHPLEGAFISGIQMGKSLLEFRISIDFQEIAKQNGFQSPSSSSMTQGPSNNSHSSSSSSHSSNGLALSSLVAVNAFRRSLNQSVQRVESFNLNSGNSSPSSSGGRNNHNNGRTNTTYRHNNKTSSTENASLYIEHDNNLVAALCQLLSSVNVNRGAGTVQQQEQKLNFELELLEGVDREQFMEHINPLTKESYGGQGNSLQSFMESSMGKKSLKYTQQLIPVYSKRDFVCNNNNFLEGRTTCLFPPITLSKLGDNVRIIRLQVKNYYNNY